MRTNYVLIDFENVQPNSVEQLDYDHFKVFLFVGAHQGRLPFELVASMQRLGDRGEYVKISRHGSDALDFHIAYYLGQFVAKDPTAYFHIISKDTDYDPLIQHLRAKKIFISRATAISEIPLVKVSNSKSSAERIELIRDWLQQRKAAKPKTVKTLGSTIAALFRKQISDKEVSGLIDELGIKGYVNVSGTKVTYTV